MYNLVVHHIYKTNSFIIGSKSYKEADKIYYLFTYDFGLIIAIAQGIRLEKSKLRYGLDDYSLINLALVRGKEFWRIVGAELIDRIEFKPKIRVLARIGVLLKRLIHGEEVNYSIYNIIEKINNAQEKIDDYFYNNLETVAIFGLLYHLGYINADQEMRVVISLDTYTKDNLEIINSKRRGLNQLINQALKNTHL